MINEQNLFSWFGDNSYEFYRRWTGPFLTAHARHTSRRPGTPWPWDLHGTIEGCLDEAWDMTGKWRARRAALVSREQFDSVVPREVAKLARALNVAGVAHLHGLSQLFDTDREAYAEVTGAIHDAVSEVSVVKPTAVIQPVFGSKVLHHFFPSVIPVFDMAYVQRGVMRLDDFAAFREDERQRWICWSYPAVGEDIKRERVLEDFRGYLDYCIARIADVEPATLARVRQRLGDMLAPCAPSSMRWEPDSLLWRMDAKLVEWSLCGAARHAGLL